MAAFDLFPKISHVRQDSSADDFWNLTEKVLNLRSLGFGSSVPVPAGQIFRLGLEFSPRALESQPRVVQRLTKEQVTG